MWAVKIVDLILLNNRDVWDGGGVGVGGYQVFNCSFWNIDIKLAIHTYTFKKKSQFVDGFNKMGREDDDK